MAKTCSTCQRSYAAHARFCALCGRPLVPTRPSGGPSRAARNLGLVAAAVVAVTTALIVFGSTRHSPSPPREGWSRFTSLVDGWSVPTIKRHFDLPRGKTDELFELLAPRDIKVVVGHRDDVLSAEGTVNELDALNAFAELLTRYSHVSELRVRNHVALLRPQWTDQRTYKLPKANARALFKVLRADDVAVGVSYNGKRHVSVNAAPADQKTVRRMVEILRGNRRP